MNFSLAPYATQAAESRGRAFHEAISRHRSPFQRDRDRIIHSTAFRRLKHKTQVFVAPEGDHYRTRLTHSLEVAQIGRSLSRTLQLDEDLCEALALAHDFGHPPFGHAGEEALNEAMGGYGVFDHNEQTLRVLTMLEKRYPAFDGLNLSWETLEGIAKHNGPVVSPSPTVAAIDSAFPLELGTFPGAEAQVAAISDDIAYNNHDLDDGLRAGAFTVADLQEVPHVAQVFEEVRREYPDVAETRLVLEMVRRLIGEMVDDVLAETGRRLAAAAPGDVAAIRHLQEPVVAFSPAMGEKERALKNFLFRRMYRHEAVVEQTGRARVVVKQLFEMFVENPQKLPPEWRPGLEARDTLQTVRIVADYIAGMTDQYALREHRQLIGKNV